MLGFIKIMFIRLLTSIVVVNTSVHSWNHTKCFQNIKRYMNQPSLINLHLIDTFKDYIQGLR